MGWDASLTCATCGDCGLREWNYTHNTSKMIYAALERANIDVGERDDGRRRSWYEALDGSTGVGSVGYLTAIIDELAAFPKVYEPMNPGNGWGHRHGLLGVLREMRDAAQDHPSFVWECSG